MPIFQHAPNTADTDTPDLLFPVEYTDLKVDRTFLASRQTFRVINTFLRVTCHKVRLAGGRAFEFYVRLGIYGSYTADEQHSSAGQLVLSGFDFHISLSLPL